MINVERLNGLYFIRPRSPRLLVDYALELGPTDVIRKVRSRRGERDRNEKYVSYGLGVVVEGRSSGPLSPGSAVAFLAPAHPACVERIVLPEELLVPVTRHALPAQLAALGEGRRPQAVLHAREPPETAVEVPAPLLGWSPFSGLDLSGDAETLAAIQALARRGLLGNLDRARPLAKGGTPITEVKPATTERRDRHPACSAVLFGYGNYAKTAIMPNLEAGVELARVHEVDPTQVPPGQQHGSVDWDTSPVARVGQRFDVHIVAGYHHTHAPLATEALKQGASVILEKPIATTHEQLDGLLAALDSSPGRLFCSFQRRYSPFNEPARRDLGVEPGEPISYHCIVYEVPLPELHWYRWPASGSRLLSNGCHWIDHFLYLNEFSTVTTREIFLAPDGTVNCSLEVSNGAVFSMLLTDRGSERLGVRDHVELRAGSATAIIEDNSRYRAERSGRSVRRRRHSRGESYRRMYRSMSKALVSGGSGNSIHSVEVSGRTTLELEDQLQAATPRPVDRHRA